jgi:hypothetical protein
MEGGKITCPHCGEKTACDKNFIFLTHALLEEQEAAFKMDS